MEIVQKTSLFLFLTISFSACNSGTVENWLYIGLDSSSVGTSVRNANFDAGQHESYYISLDLRSTDSDLPIQIHLMTHAVSETEGYGCKFDRNIDPNYFQVTVGGRLNLVNFQGTSITTTFHRDDFVNFINFGCYYTTKEDWSEVLAAYINNQKIIGSNYTIGSDILDPVILKSRVGINFFSTVHSSIEADNFKISDRPDY